MPIPRYLLTFIVVASLQHWSTASADSTVFTTFSNQAKEQISALNDQAESNGAANFDTLEQWAATQPETAAAIRGQIAGEIENACLDTANNLSAVATYQPACLCIGDKTVEQLWKGQRADVEDDQFILGDLPDAEQLCFEAFPVK